MFKKRTTENKRVIKPIKEPKIKKPEDKFSFKFKRLFFGIGKEFTRVTWSDRSKLLKSIVVLVILTAILASLFLGVDYLIKK